MLVKESTNVLNALLATSLFQISMFVRLVERTAMSVMTRDVSHANNIMNSFNQRTHAHRIVQPSSQTVRTVHLLRSALTVRLDGSYQEISVKSASHLVLNATSMSVQPVKNILS